MGTVQRRFSARERQRSRLRCGSLTTRASSAQPTAEDRLAQFTLQMYSEHKARALHLPDRDHPAYEGWLGMVQMMYVGLHPEDAAALAEVVEPGKAAFLALVEAGGLGIEEAAVLTVSRECGQHSAEIRDKLKDRSRGLCYACGEQVRVHDARIRLRNGAYAHKKCSAALAADGQWTRTAQTAAEKQQRDRTEPQTQGVRRPPSAREHVGAEAAPPPSRQPPKQERADRRRICEDETLCRELLAEMHLRLRPGECVARRAAQQQLAAAERVERSHRALVLAREEVARAEAASALLQAVAGKARGPALAASPDAKRQLPSSGPTPPKRRKRSPLVS
eukprot:TRINITY_DN10111_c0_g2_i1.p1 TRINITY_DN10111_c0_g2~~TRINITY_DN10111_c0_g2_i1.p1  ORF type:complete len:335 (+),score=79.72 TRINITY_DN10111_c0_g2_i1:117-1121(+)